METDYWHSLDDKNYFRINPKTLGVSTLPTKKGIEQLKARVFEGARNVELGFMGKEKGNLGQGGITPEMHSKEEREEIRQMAKLNEVDLSTHASIAIGGLAGLGKSGFEPEQREVAVNEIKRTVDFAADVAGGGPVVVHTGEFPRAIMAADKEFLAHPEEEKKRIHYLVDEVSGDIIKTVRGDEVIFEPEAKTDKEGNIVYQKNPDGSPKTDKDGNRLAEYKLDEKTGEIALKRLQFGEFREELAEKYGEKKADEIAPKEFFKRQQQTDIEHSKGYAEEYESRYKDALETKKKFENLRDDFKRIDDPVSKQAFLDEVLKKNRMESGQINADDGERFFENMIKQADQTISYSREFATSSRKQVKQREEIIKRAQPIAEFGVKESAKTLARSAIYAYDKEKAMKLKKKLFVAPENIFPEQFGSHPQELKKLVLESRRVMEKELKDRGISGSKAKKIADDHIKATFDVGHANTWKKYFDKKPGETQKQADKRFKKWMVKQTEDLQKAGVIGHVHLSDNFGYYDEHLAPGEGNVPIKELIKKLEEKGYKGKTIVEGGAQTPEQSFRVWSTALGLNSSTYKMDGNWSWTDMQGSYFGRTGSPTYLVGEHVPSKDWTLWSETQLE